MTTFPSERHAGPARRARQRIKRVHNVAEQAMSALAFFFFRAIGLRFAVCRSRSVFGPRVCRSFPSLAGTRSY
jgi:hypothetical protein